MRLNGFSIENFRSIQKSGWCEISVEEVAVLVGQNEAGKSSILEALMAFQTQDLDQNDLRSDGSFPKVCSGQVISDSSIGFLDVDLRSKALGDMLPSFECSLCSL